MNPHPLTGRLCEANGSKIVLVAADGLGGLPLEPGGKTELESARTPHLDALARQGTCGLSIPLLPGITTSPGTGLLALLGYDPLHSNGLDPAQEVEPIRQLYGIRALALTADPVCRDVARRVGLDALAGPPALAERADLLRPAWDNYDFFLLHDRDADAAGAAGNFDAKVRALERLDGVIPQLLALNPDVLAVTGGHSTPAKLRGPSCHPVPVVLWAKTCRPDAVREFGETACALGGLGQFPASQLMTLLLAYARRLKPFGD